MTPEEIAARLTARLHTEVGAFFYNTPLSARHA